MIKTFKETITSLKDKNYGSVIITKPLGQVLWYWTKYFLLLSIVTVFLIIAVLTYFIPQIPKLLQPFPDYFSVKSGQFSSSVTQPAFYGSSDFPIILDTSATNSSVLEKSQIGILIMSDKIVVKQEDQSIQTQSISEVPDFSFDKKSTISWVAQNQPKLWLIICLGVIIASALISILLWSGRVFGFIIWALIFWAISKIIKYPISYVQCAKLVIYASVIPLLMSAILTFAPNTILSFANLAIFLYFGLTWLITLSKSTKTVTNKVPEPIVTAKKTSKKVKK